MGLWAGYRVSLKKAINRTKGNHHLAQDAHGPQSSILQSSTGSMCKTHRQNAHSCCSIASNLKE